MLGPGEAGGVGAIVPGGSHVSNVDHSVSQAALDQPDSGVVGASVYPWLVKTAVSALAVGSASIAAAYCWA